MALVLKASQLLGCPVPVYYKKCVYIYKYSQPCSHENILVHHLGAGFWPLIFTRGEQMKHVLKYALGMAIYKKL